MVENTFKNLKIKKSNFENYVILHCDKIIINEDILIKHIRDYKPSLLHSGDYYWNNKAFHILSMLGHTWQNLSTRNVDFSTSFKATRHLFIIKENLIDEFNIDIYNISDLEAISIGFNLFKNGHRVQYISPSKIGKDLNKQEGGIIPKRDFIRSFVKMNYPQKQYFYFSLLSRLPISL